jgi:hypothetical protein
LPTRIRFLAAFLVRKDTRFMASEKQIEANRQNAQKSTGPTSDQGKRASSKNSLKFGIHTADIALYDDPESADDVRRNLNELIDFYQPTGPLQRDCLEELAICRAQARRLVRLGTGLLNDSRAHVLIEHLYTGPDGNPIRRFDLSLYDPEERRNVANMHLGLAWLRVQAPMEAISRQEARLATRLRRAEARFDILFGAATAREPVSDDLVSAPPSGAGSQPAAPCQGACAPETTPAPAPEAQSAQPVLQNEPNSDPEPIPEPTTHETPAQPRTPVLENEPNFPQPPVVATNNPPSKPPAPHAPLPNPAKKDIA